VYARGFATSASAERDANTAEDRETLDPRISDPLVDEPSSKALEIIALGQQITEMKANWQRSSAEADNMSKKMHKEIAQMRESAAEKMAPALFPVADAMDLYLTHRPNFELEEHQNNTDAKGAFDGLEVAKKHFNAAMMGIKISEITPQIGDQFDPMIHNACFEVKGSGNLMPGQVGTVLKSGWAKDRTLLRLADVALVSADEGEEISDESNA